MSLLRPDVIKQHKPNQTKPAENNPLVKMISRTAQLQRPLRCKRLGDISQPSARELFSDKFSKNLHKLSSET